MANPCIVTKVAAAFKYPAGKPIMKKLRAGDVLILEREPTNAFDRNAIRILWRDLLLDAVGESVQLGYVPAIVAEKLKTCRLIRCEKIGAAWDAIVITYQPYP